MSEFAVARQLAGQLLAACDAIDKAAEAVERARMTERRVTAAVAQLEAVNAEMAKAKREVDTHVKTRKAELETAEREATAAREAEKRKHDAWKATAENEMQEKTDALAQWNTKIAEARKLHAELLGEIAKHRATLTESAAKFAHG